MSESFPAITVYQPWATLIAEGAKPHEFRGWAPAGRMIGRRIAIHAGARPVRKEEVRKLLAQLQSRDWRETGVDREIAVPLLERVLNAPKILPLSSVLCTAVLGKPIRNKELAAAMGIPWLNDSDRHEHSNWGWPLSQIEVLEPFVPAKGAQGWWEWKPGTGGVRG